MYKVICRKQICPDFQTKGCKQIEDHSLFVCDQCPFSSRRKDMTQSHVQFVHEGVIFKCDQCTICTVKTRGALERHVLLKHPGPEQKANPLLCTEIECTFMTVADIDMKRHTREKHEGRIKYRCNIMNCNYGTEQQKDLHYHTKSHLKTQGREKSNKCNQCNYSSHYKHILMTHLKIHSGEKSNKCNQCGFASIHPSSLKIHLQMLSGEKSNKCSQCDYTSSYAHHLKRHLKAHSAEKSNKCDQCDYASYREYALKTHLQMHSGEKSNKCNQCDCICSG